VPTDGPRRTPSRSGFPCLSSSRGHSVFAYYSTLFDIPQLSTINIGINLLTTPLRNSAISHFFVQHLPFVAMAVAISVHAFCFLCIFLKSGLCLSYKHEWASTNVASNPSSMVYYFYQRQLLPLMHRTNDSILPAKMHVTLLSALLVARALTPPRRLSLDNRTQRIVKVGS
jgi:hypothetical protein